MRSFIHKCQIQIGLGSVRIHLHGRLSLAQTLLGVSQRRIGIGKNYLGLRIVRIALQNEISVIMRFLKPVASEIHFRKVKLRF